MVPLLEGQKKSPLSFLIWLYIIKATMHSSSTPTNTLLSSSKILSGSGSSNSISAKIMIPSEEIFSWLIMWSTCPSEKSTAKRLSLETLSSQDGNAQEDINNIF